MHIKNAARRTRAAFVLFVGAPASRQKRTGAPGLARQF
jgi:hypothetical protein